MKTDLYTDGYIIKYDETEQSLERGMINHKEDLFDSIYTIKDEDTLTSIAYRFYKEPLYWFIIADVNNILNPLELNVGDKLIIPNINKYNL